MSAAERMMSSCGGPVPPMRSERSCEPRVSGRARSSARPSGDQQCASTPPVQLHWSWFHVRVSQTISSHSLLAEADAVAQNK